VPPRRPQRSDSAEDDDARRRRSRRARREQRRRDGTGAHRKYPCETLLVGRNGSTFSACPASRRKLRLRSHQESSSSPEGFTPSTPPCFTTATAPTAGSVSAPSTKFRLTTNLASRASRTVARTENTDGLRQPSHESSLNSSTSHRLQSRREQNWTRWLRLWVTTYYRRRQIAAPPTSSTPTPRLVVSKDIFVQLVGMGTDPAFR